jgi:predicted nucleic acid-binding protein
MITALDTDVLVHWLMDGAPRHRAVRRLIEAEVRDRGHTVGLVPQVLFEFMHVATDARRFDVPLTMDEAQQRVDTLWCARDAARVEPSAGIVPRTVDLMRRLQLGRKRILDTALAATLEAAGVKRLATLNPGDYAVFPFIDVVTLP